MADSSLSGLDPTPQELNDTDLVLISQQVQGSWVSFKLTLAQLKVFIRFGLDIESIFGLSEALTGKANASHGHVIADISGLATALSGKAPIVHTHQQSDITGLETALANKAASVHGHAITDVTGLSDALTAKVGTSQLGAANGVATLGADGKLSSSQVPQPFIWIVVETDSSLFPAEGVVGVIYIDSTSNITYRWDADAQDYIVVSGGIIQLTLGDQASQAYPGDKGKIAYDHSQSPHAPADAQKNSDITQVEIENKLIGPITSHTHPIASVNGLEDALNNKAGLNHTHEINDVNGLAAALDNKVGVSSLGVSNGTASLDENALLKLAQLPDLNFVLTPQDIVVEQVISSSGGITIPVDRVDIVQNGTAFSGDLSSPTQALEFYFEWIGEQPAKVSFIQGETLQFKFAETNDLSSDTSDVLTVTLEFNDADNNGQIERQAKVTVSNSLVLEEGLMFVGADGNQVDLEFVRDDGVLTILFDNFPILTVDLGVVHNFMHFVALENTLQALTYQFNNTSETTYTLPFDLEDGKLYRVSINCTINSRTLYAGDCFIFYANKARILIFRSSLYQQNLENYIQNHGHLVTQVEGLTETLNGIQLELTEKTDVGHTHAISAITGLQAILDNLTSGLSGKANATHTHAIEDIVNLQTTLNGIASSLAGKANSVHTHTIANVTGLQTALDDKAALGHSHPEITGEYIIVNNLDQVTSVSRVENGDSTELAIAKLQFTLDILTGFKDIIFEPSGDFPYYQVDGTLYRFNDGTVTGKQSTQSISISPGYYRLVAGAARVEENDVVDVDGKWTRVYKTSNSAEVYVSQETLGLDPTAVGDYKSEGNKPYGIIPGVGYASNEVFPYLFKQIEELHKGIYGVSPAKGTQSGAISVSAILVVPVTLDATILIGANKDTATNDEAGFVWIREVSAGSIIVPFGFVLTNSIYNGTILGWDEVGTITIGPDTFSGYNAKRSNVNNEVVVIDVAALGTPTGDVYYKNGIESDDGLIKFIDLVYTNTGGGSFTVKENGVDLFGELFSTLPAKVKIRTLSNSIFEISLLDSGDVVTSRKVVFTDGEINNLFYHEALFTVAGDVEPTNITVESLINPDFNWINNGSVNDFVYKVMYWDRVNQFNTGTVGSPVMVDQYYFARPLPETNFVEIDVSDFDNVGEKGVNIYLSTNSDLTLIMASNLGKVSLNNVDNAGTIVTTLTNFVNGEIELTDAAALAINSIKLTRTSATTVLVEYDDGTTVISNTFTVPNSSIYVLVESRGGVGGTILNLPYNNGTV